jgi:uncharacterized membrane protein
MLALLLEQRIEPTDLERSLRLLDLPAAWIVILVVLPFFGAVAWIGYRRETLSRAMRTTLLCLRMAAFVLLALVLARPVHVERREEIHPASVLVLMDDSASMRRSDSYGDEELREALREASGLNPAEATRLDLARKVVERALLPMLERGSYGVELYSFSENASPLNSLVSLSGRGGATHLGDSLFQALVTQRGRHVTDVVVVSDGRSNGGTSPLEAARAAGHAGIPVHALIVGDTRAEKNAILELIDAPGDAIEGDELGVTVRVRGRGTRSDEVVQVIMEELDDSTGALVVAEELVTLTEAGERVVLIAPGRASGPGRSERRLRVSITPLEGETMVDDNRLEFTVHVSPARIRVLFVEGYPRWEYRFVKNLLLRSDRNIEVQCYLLSATKDFPQEASDGLESLTSIPTTRQELLANYDVILLGDIDPYSISPDPKKCEDFLRSVREFVEAGGGVLFQAGEYYNPRALVNTPLVDVLPVQLDPTRILSFEGDTRNEFRPLLEDPTHPHEILRLSADPDTNRALWEDPVDGLRGFYWYLPIRQVKPGAQVLLRHPHDKNLQSGKNYPLMVLGYFPAGRTMFLALDSTYRWRYRYGDRYLDTFWRNAIRWLALGRLKSGDRRYRIESSRSSYDLEDRVQLEVRVLDEDFRPSEESTQKVGWSGPDGVEHELELRREGDRLGVYRGGLELDRPGLYRAWVLGRVDGRNQRASSTEFEVVLPSRENQDPSPDPETLRTLCERTGGTFLELSRASLLATQFPGGEERREPISSRLEDAWDSWHTLLLALALLGTEWILRKRSELL